MPETQQQTFSDGLNKALKTYLADAAWNGDRGAALRAFKAREIFLYPTTIGNEDLLPTSDESLDFAPEAAAFSDLAQSLSLVMGENGIINTVKAFRDLLADSIPNNAVA